ncbi:hypothetical protein [Acidisphaera sp. S103]|uniref:hypothetical protein n=1 Tax=Acidisphaera sp. S103 TaxID=1747223 RepID=UPI00131AFEA9|nr:hypothetical protein [Acidisphaera sp. S103]
MSDEPRIVLDTNAIISRIIRPNSTAGRTVRFGMETSHVLAFEATMTELPDVLSRHR